MRPRVLWPTLLLACATQKPVDPDKPAPVPPDTPAAASPAAAQRTDDEICRLAGHDFAYPDFERDGVRNLRCGDGPGTDCYGGQTHCEDGKLTALDCREMCQQHMIFTSSRFDGANLSRYRLDLASFRGASMVGARLTKLHVFAARFNEATLTGAVLDGANLERVTFTRADLGDASLVDIEALGGEWDRLRAIGARFDRARLTETILSDSDLSNASFRGARLDGCHIHHTRFDGACFDDADLERTDLARANTINASFTRTRR